MQFYFINSKQIETIKQLHDSGLYMGPFPDRPMDIHEWNIERYAIQNTQEIW